jgi:serine phosphatase RsbU (regulator of sigma subunit)
MPTPAAIEYGVAARPFPGQKECGDLHAVVTRPSGTLIAVADGLGHGPEAALAARLAMATLSTEAHLPVLRLVTRCHEALVKTRGVALGLAFVEWSDETMTWLSIGNVAGLLVRAGPQGTLAREYVLTRNGVVGARLPPLRAATLPLQRHDLLVFATDGVREGFQSEIRPDAPPQVTADRILARYARPTDDALVLLGRWNGPSAAEAA